MTSGTKFRLASVATTATPTQKIGQFPAAAVRSALRAELIQAVKSEASVKGTTLPSAPNDIAKANVDIDSLVVVSLLVSVEPQVGFELPESVVRTGGYKSVDAAVDHLLPRIEAEWKKKKGVTT
jgi:hypothetical protein